MLRTCLALMTLALLAASCAQPSEAAASSTPATPPTTGTTISDGTVPAPRVVSRPTARPLPAFYETVTPPVEPVPPRMGALLPREVNVQGHTAFAVVGNLVLLHPSASVELIGFHESNHDGARQMELVDTTAEAFTMPTRFRGTGSRTAADIVIQPGVEVVAPVDGLVIRAGSYTLYCDYTDHFAVIAPDDEPGWEVKVLHFLNLQVVAGDRVEAGITVLGSGPRPLPFRSQVDDASAAPSWPHVHIEVVDPSIPDRPSGSGC